MTSFERQTVRPTSYSCPNSPLSRPRGRSLTVTPVLHRPVSLDRQEFQNINYSSESEDEQLDDNGRSPIHPDQNLESSIIEEHFVLPSPVLSPADLQQPVSPISFSPIALSLSRPVSIARAEPPWSRSTSPQQELRFALEERMASGFTGLTTPTGFNSSVDHESRATSEELDRLTPQELRVRLRTGSQREPRPGRLEWVHLRWGNISAQTPHGHIGEYTQAELEMYRRLRIFNLLDIVE
jgi:hypothetical protein